MKPKTISRLVATLLTIAMVMGLLVVVPFTASAEEAPSSPAVELEINKGGEVDTWDGTVSEALSGAGTVESPYLIRSAADFAFFYRNLGKETAPADAYYSLMTNVKFEGNNTATSLSGLGNSSGGLTYCPAFSGVLNGNGYTVSGVTRYDGSMNTSPLFGALSGTITNIVLDSFSAKGPAGRDGTVFASITNGGVFSNVKVSALTLAGAASGFFKNYSGGTVTIENVDIDVTFTENNSGSSSGTYFTYIGALFGKCDGSDGADKLTVKNVDANISITAPSSTKEAYYGGLVGYMGAGSATIEEASFDNCHVSGSMSDFASADYAMIFIGGFMARCNVTTSLTLNNCTTDMSITASPKKIHSFAGFIAKANSAVTFNNCTNNTSVYNTIVSAGGFVADTSASLTFNGCVNNADITGAGQTNGAGGFVGELITVATLTFKDCANAGNVSYYNSGADAGKIGGAGGYVGLAGDVTSHTTAALSAYYFHNCSQTGDIIANINTNAAGSHAGGLIGLLKGLWHTNNGEKIGQTLEVKSCYIAGSVSGGYGSGAILGSFYVGGSTGRRFFTMDVTNTIISTEIHQHTATGGGSEGIVIGYSDKTDPANNVTNKLNISDSVYVITSGITKDGEGTIDVPVYPSANTNAFTTTGATQELTDAMLTNGTAKSVLNGYAVDSGYTPWIQGATAPVYITEVDFSGATMTLGENMMLNLKLDKTILDGTGVTSVTFVKNGEATPGNASVDANGYYTASFACDAADLAKTANYNIVVETATAAYTSVNVLTYAPIEYATALYNDERYPETQDVIEKMLSMASLSEKAKYGAESTAIATAASNAGITLLTGEALAIPENMKYYALKAEDANAAIAIINNYVMSGADLNGSVNLVFKVTDASITQVTVTSGDVYNETFDVVNGYVTITGLGAKHIANLITIEFHDANGLVASTNFSVGNYLQTVITNANTTDAVKNLASAMVLYMMSVKAYAGA